MIELPKGEIIESRRGNNGILKALLDNMKSQEWTGYIRTERKPKDEAPSQGFLLVLSGDIRPGAACSFGIEFLDSGY